jgi:hypothetical protein
MLLLLFLLSLKLYADSRGELKLSQSVDGLSSRLEDIEETFMSSNFELFTTLFVDVWTAKHRITAYARRQRNWASDLGARFLGEPNDV